MKKNLFILGMHRSGTSAIAGAVAKCGFYPGPNLLPPDPNFNDSGFFESDTVLSIHNAFLSEFGVDWRHCYRLPSNCFTGTAAQKARSSLSALIDEMQGQQPWCIKDPRASVLFPLWQQVLEEKGVEYKVLLAQRSPGAVAASLTRRNNIDKNHGLVLWLYHCLNAEFYSRATNRAVIQYEQFLKDPQAELIEAFSKLGLAEIQVSEELGVDPKLEHVSAEDYPEWMMSIYRELCSSPTNFETLDNLRNAIWPLMPMLPDVMELETAASSRLRSLEMATTHIKNLEQITRSERQCRQALDGRIEVLGQELRETTVQLKRESKELHKQTCEIEQVRSELLEVKQAYQAVTSSTFWNLTRPIRRTVERLRGLKSRLNIHQIALKPEQQIQLVNGAYEVTGAEPKFVLISNRNEYPVGPLVFGFDLTKGSDLVQFKLVATFESEQKQEIEMPVIALGKNRMRFELTEKISLLELCPLGSEARFDLNSCYLQPLA